MTWTITLSFDRAAMHLNKMPRYRQTQSEAAMPACSCSVCLLKTRKYLRQEIGADSCAIVADDDLDHVAGAFQPCLNTPTLSRELHCICQKIPDYLLQPGAITPDVICRRIQQ